MGAVVVGLEVVPVAFDVACAFVDEQHRHHRRPPGMKFCLGVEHDNQLVGVAIAGRPVARLLQDGRTVEVLRTVTDGTPNVNSMLYGAIWRAAKALGYRRAITYIQEGEPGTSLRAVGWVVANERAARPGWDTPSRRRTDRGTDRIARTRWEISR